MQKIDKDLKILIIMVGLPARGKSFLAKKICKLLIWLDYECKVFNLSNYRRDVIGTKDFKSIFFDVNNEDAVNQREMIAEMALNDLFDYFYKGGKVAIYDGSNTTSTRRKQIIEKIKQSKHNIYYFGVESIIDEDNIVNQNLKLNSQNPDYQGMTLQQSINDIKDRILKYIENYTDIQKSENLPFIKIFNQGQKFVINNVKGYIPCKVLYYIMNLNLDVKPIYLTRCGDKVKPENTDEETFGGDFDLNEQGNQYSKMLFRYFDKESKRPEFSQGWKILYSTRKAAKRTTSLLESGENVLCNSMKCLDELNFGTIEGWTISELKRKLPDVYKGHMQQFLDYKYPQGESHQDLINRLEPVILEIERSRVPILIVSHHSVLKCLYSYISQNFNVNQTNEIPKINISKNQVIKLIPDIYFCKEQDIKMDLYKMSMTFHEKNTDTIWATGNTKTGFSRKKKSYLSLDNIEKVEFLDRGHIKEEYDKENSDSDDNKAQ